MDNAQKQLLRITTHHRQNPLDFTVYTVPVRATGPAHIYLDLTILTILREESALVCIPRKTRICHVFVFISNATHYTQKQYYTCTEKNSSFLQKKSSITFSV